MKKKEKSGNGKRGWLLRIPSLINNARTYVGAYPKKGSQALKKFKIFVMLGLLTES